MCILNVIYCTYVTDKICQSYVNIPAHVLIFLKISNFITFKLFPLKLFQII